MLDLDGTAKPCHRQVNGSCHLDGGGCAAERHPKALDLVVHRPRARRCRAEEIEQMTADIVAAIKTVYDPEIPRTSMNWA